MFNPSSFTPHSSAGQMPHNVASLKGGGVTFGVTEKNQTRLSFNTPVQGLRSSEPLMQTQHATAQVQERNIRSTEPLCCNLNQGMLSYQNHYPPVSTHTDQSSSGSSPFSTVNTQFTVHHHPSEETTSVLMTAPPSLNQNSQLPPISQFAQTNQYVLSHSQQNSGLRPDSQDPFLSRGFTRSNSTPSPPAPYPQATGMSSESQQLTHFPHQIVNQPSHQFSHDQHQQLVPQSHSLVSSTNIQESSMSSTQVLSVRPALDICNPGTSTVNRHDPAKKKPQQLQAVVKTVSNSNAFIPALKTDLSSTVRDTMPTILREQLKTELSDAVRSMMPEILREQLKASLSDAVRSMMPEILREQLEREVPKVMMPALQEQVSKMAPSLMTKIIPWIQTCLEKSVLDTAKPLMEAQLGEANIQLIDRSDKILKETTKKQTKALEENFSKLQEQQEKNKDASNRTIETLIKAPDVIIPKIQLSLTTALSDLSEKAASSMEEFMQTTMKDSHDKTEEKLLEQSRKSVQDAMDAMEGEFKETVSTLREQHEKVQATSLQTAEAFRKTTDDLKELVNAQTEIQNSAQTTASLHFPQIDPVGTTEADPASSTSSDMIQETPDGPPTKKMRTSGESCAKPVSDVEVKKTNFYLEELSTEVSKAMGIRPLTTNECTTGQLLLLAARLINDDKELLIQAAKPRTKRPAGNPNHQERMKAERDKRKKMQDEINSGFQELEKSVRRFSQDRLKEKLPDSYDSPYEIIQKAYAILNDQNINDPVRSSVKKHSLRNTGGSANLSEFHKNAMALLAREKRETKTTFES